MNKFVIILFTIASFTGYAQENKIDLGRDKVLNIYKEVKTYDSNPRYWLDIKSSDCTYEILVNDIPLTFYHDRGSNAQVSISLNTRILKSGEQNLKIKIYPALNDSFSFRESLSNTSEIDVSISYGEFGKEKAKDYRKVLEYKTPTMETAYYQAELSFKAAVPYELTGWSKSVDLSKDKEENLLAEVEKKYREFIKLYENKNSDIILEKYYQREKEIAQSLFANKNTDSKVVVDKIDKDLNKNIPFKFEKYSLKIFGNGRVVALIRNDKFYRGLSAFFPSR